MELFDLVKMVDDKGDSRECDGGVCGNSGDDNGDDGGSADLVGEVETEVGQSRWGRLRSGLKPGKTGGFSIRD